MANLNTVGLVGGDAADECIEVLSALAGSCGLSVRRTHANEKKLFTGLIVLDTTNTPAGVAGITDLHSIHVMLSDAFRSSAEVRFDAGVHAPPPFRARSLVTGSGMPGKVMDLPGEVIATADGVPVWTTTLERGQRRDTCVIARPWIKKGECVFQHLNRNRFMNLLPVLEWLRSISGWAKWKQPPLRACFMFDDPNLHAATYGFVGYEQLATEGRRHRYHCSFATVPLDGYYVNRAAAKIIYDNRETLSLLIHGNNHTYRELANRKTAGEQLAMMQQAIHRTSRLERKADVAVSRVMAPPHGICAAKMMTAMADAGLEAVCVSHGSVWTGNPGVNWTVSLGASSALVAAGLPVIPRFGLDHKPENNILLAAYLNQPIILVGHHCDLADGTDILSSAARFINDLGSIRWVNMTTIARSNYRCTVQGHIMRIHTFSRVMAINIPEGVSELEVEAPWLAPRLESVECRSSGNDAQKTLPLGTSTGLHFSVTPGGSVELRVVRACRPCEQRHRGPTTPLRVIARKVLVELRDRSMPCVPRRWVKRLK